MGEVYRARDPRLPAKSPSKYCRACSGSIPSGERASNRRPGRPARSIIPTSSPSSTLARKTGALYVVEELLEGETLRQQLAQGPVPARKAIDYAVQAAHGLAAAHEKGIIHRDLKPENMFLTGRRPGEDPGFRAGQAGRPGAAGRHLAPTGTLETEPGMVMGTVGYMSPEQVRGQTVDHRADYLPWAPSCSKCSPGGARSRANRPWMP